MTRSITPATTPAELAQRFHEAYERLAPRFGVVGALPWAEVPDRNRQLMTAVCAEVLGVAPVVSVTTLLDDPDLDPDTRRLIAGDCLARANRHRCALVAGHEGPHTHDGVHWT